MWRFTTRRCWDVAHCLGRQTKGRGSAFSQAANLCLSVELRCLSTSQSPHMHAHVKATSNGPAWVARCSRNSGKETVSKAATPCSCSCLRDMHCSSKQKQHQMPALKTFSQIPPRRTPLHQKNNACSMHFRSNNSSPPLSAQTTDGTLLRSATSCKNA